MTFGDLIFGLPQEEKLLLRQIEQTRKKLTKTKYAIAFNRTCLKENILPKYTNIKTHDPAARDQEFTKDYRRKLIEYQVRKQEQTWEQLQQKLNRLQEHLSQRDIDHAVLQSILEALDEVIDRTNHATKIRTIKKLSKLYGGPLLLPEASDGYVNLSNTELTQDQKQVLNLGLNCHIQTKFNSIEKQADLELLYQDIQKLEKDKKVVVDEQLKEQLLAEATKARGSTKSRLLSDDLKSAARALRENDNIVTRKADKSNIFVILDKQEYLAKLSAILSDSSKFERLTRDPTKQLTSKLNKVITSANAAIGAQHFAKITGEYSPGYIYGNVKIHKPGNPLRPIISQIPAPTYELAKKLNGLLTPYTPSKYSLKSTNDFIDIIRSSAPQGLLASLDVESLFTNVPVEQTIDIIIEQVYHHPTLPPLAVPKGILETMLRSCTMDAPFRAPDGKLYRQINGVAMGSPLGCLFADMYMCHVENKVLEDSDMKPHIYCRYVDDIFVSVRDTDHLDRLRQRLQTGSVLTFTTELSIDNKIPFLDLDLDGHDGTFKTKVHRKPTDKNKTMHGESECPKRYHISVIRALVRRGITHCSDWQTVHEELQFCKQTLVNNGFSNADIDSEIKSQLDRAHQRQQTTKPDTITLMVKNQMSSSYRVDERVLTDIVLNNIHPTQDNVKIKLHIYYKNKKAHTLIMKNNLTQSDDKLKRTNVIYKYSCPHEDCLLRKTDYIGLTTTTLSRRLTMHLRDGAPSDHMTQKHHRHITRHDLTDNTTIITTCNDKRRLHVLEALYIRKEKPLLNKQLSSCITLCLFS